MPKNLKTILESCQSLKNRGPDKTVSRITSTGIYMFHRLAINDTSSRGDQPMFSQGVMLMCNGEIYNCEKLAKEYNLNLNSKSDCEVILQLYHKFGFVETITKLDGVFAVVLVDGDMVYLARDRIGVRPLFTGTTSDGDLSVCSVVNPLLKFCGSVEAFPPGLIAKYSKEDFFPIITPIYKDAIRIPLSRINNAAERLHNILLESVKKRLLSDRPIACLLSGGLDSSIVTALLCKLSPYKVRTYSVGMEGSTDLHYAKIVAKHLGTEHHEILFTPEEGFSCVQKVIEILGSYDITTIRASVGMYIVSKFIKEKGKDVVIMSGEGADELLCGYLYFHNAPNCNEAEKETLSLVKNLYLYDVLRADRIISSQGLELRVPFLDKNVVDTVLSIPAVDKIPMDGYEKFFLREAFENYLPKEVLWRQKCAFSDGVSSVKKSWYQHIQEMVENKIPDEIYNPKKYVSKEAMYYKLIFDSLFPGYNLEIPYWMPKWSDAKDPSARTLKVCAEKDVSGSEWA